MPSKVNLGRHLGQSKAFALSVRVLPDGRHFQGQPCSLLNP